MKKLLAGVSALGFLFAANVASAEEVSGEIEMLIPSTRTVALDDGVTYRFDQSVSLEKIFVGDMVTFEVDTRRDGNVVSAIKDDGVLHFPDSDSHE